MTTVVYTFVSRCAGGGHTTFDIAVDGGPVQRIVYPTDEVRAPLNQLTEDEQNQAKLLVLKLHMRGKTRAQIITELANPVTVTI